MSVPNDSVVFSNSNTNPVVSVVLSIDRSGSMGAVIGGDFTVPITRLQKVQMAAAIFVTNMQCPEMDGIDVADYLGVISFSTVTDICVPEDGGKELLELLHLTDKEDVHKRILALTPGGGTYLGKACQKGSELLENYSIPRAQILLSDGLSTQRGFSAEDLNPDIPVYTIGYTSNSGNQNPQNDDLLQEIADHTGGLYYPSVLPDDLTDIYNDIASQLGMFKVVVSESRRFRSFFSTLICDVPAGQRPGEKFAFRIVLTWQDSRIKFVGRDILSNNEITVYLRQGNSLVPLEVVQDFDDFGLPNSAIMLKGELTESGDPYETRRLTVLLGGHNSEYVDVRVALLVYDRSISFDAQVESAKITQGDDIKYQLRVLDDGEPVERVNYNILMSVGEGDDIATPYNRQQELNLAGAKEGKDHFLRGSIKAYNEGTHKFKVEAQGYSEKSGKKFKLTRLMNVRVTI